MTFWQMVYLTQLMVFLHFLGSLLLLVHLLLVTIISFLIIWEFQVFIILFIRTWPSIPILRQVQFLFMATAVQLFLTYLSAKTFDTIQLISFDLIIELIQLLNYLILIDKWIIKIYLLSKSSILTKILSKLLVLS